MHILDWSYLIIILQLVSALYWILQVYVLSKLLTENAAFQFANDNGIDLVSIITTTVAGPFLTTTIPSSIRVLLSPLTGILLFLIAILHQGPCVYLQMIVDHIYTYVCYVNIDCFRGSWILFNIICCKFKNGIDCFSPYWRYMQCPHIPDGASQSTRSIYMLHTKLWDVGYGSSSC